jgi:hypothetical protein
MSKLQHRPACRVCGRWRRRDHRCPGPPAAVDAEYEALAARPIRADWWKKGVRG